MKAMIRRIVLMLMGALSTSPQPSSIGGHNFVTEFRNRSLENPSRIRKSD
jgi:hypothetical protein